MLRFQKNDRYTSIAIYAFIVLATLMLGVVICINIPFIMGQFWRFVNVLRPITFAMVFAYICNPIVRYAERRLLKRLQDRKRLARVLSLLLTYLFLSAIIAVLAFMIVPQIAYNYQDFSSNIVRYINLLTERVDGWIRDTGIFGESYDGLANLIHPSDIAAAISTALGWLTAQLGTLSLQLLETAGVVLIGILLSASMLYHKEALSATVKKIALAIFPRRVYRGAREALMFADRAFGQFIIGKLIDSFIVGVITFVVLAIVQMPYYPLISAIVCVTSIIPAFGYVIGAIPSFFIILMKDPIMALWFLVILVAIQQLDGNIIGPKIVGSATGLASVWVITAIMLMGAYFGPIGWFIGVPLFSVIYRMVGDLVNRHLQKKGRPIALSYYEGITMTEESLTQETPVCLPEAAETEEAHEKVDE